MWRNGTVEADDFPFAQISDYLEQPDCVVWADLCAPDAEQLTALAEELGLDRHAVEDSASEHARPKATRFATHIFLSTYAMRVDESGGVALTHVSAFCLPTALITVRLDDGFDMGEVVQRWDANSDLLKYGKRALEYGLLDTIVDGYFDTLQVLDDEIEALQDILFDDSQNDARPLQRRTFELRSALLRARRVLLPMRDLVETVMRRATESDVSQDLLSYFQDLNDHILRAADWSESLREMVSSIFETNISLADARLNIVVRRLTAWAAIVAVPTALTGFFGQNLRFPGFGTRTGFTVSLSLIVVICVGLWAVFRRKGWL